MKNLLLKISALFAISVLVLPTFSLAADSGADLFATKCGSCHGKTGAADTPMAKNMKLRDLGSADVQKASDQDLKDTISKGKPPKMPAYSGKLTDAQIDELVKYIRSLKK